ncbi:MAG TPA: glycosyltransferase family 4 protein [Verrucomicrobiae bacterium]|nr:glycosyltransferase family 4 protein [Verrucomicrobiae bacterium]
MPPLNSPSAVRNEKLFSQPTSSALTVSPPPTSTRPPRFAGTRVIVVVFSYYEKDPRVRREAEALKRAGADVEVICLRAHLDDVLRTEIEGVRLQRIPLKRRREGKIIYAYQYAVFLLAALFRVSLWSMKKRGGLVHIHNMPDILVFSALLARVRGAKVVLDLHDPMPELMRSINDLPESHWLIGALKRLEKWSISFAHFVLTPNIAFKELFVNRGCPSDKICVVMNSPEEKYFHRASTSFPEPKRTGSFTLIYHGLLEQRSGADLAVRALPLVRKQIPDVHLHIYGDRTQFLDETIRFAAEIGVQDCVTFHGFKPLNEIVAAILAADLGLVPNRLTPFTQLNLPTRIFEYLAMGKPVVAPRTKGVLDYFTEDELMFFEPGNSEDLAGRIVWAFEHPQELLKFVEKGAKVQQAKAWQFEQDRFLHTVDQLLSKR